MAKPVVRMTVNLTPEVAEALESLAERLNTTRTDALHQAILTSALLQKELEEGNDVFVRAKDASGESHLRLVKSSASA